jgi:hypothetical protein
MTWSEFEETMISQSMEFKALSSPEKSKGWSATELSHGYNAPVVICSQHGVALASQGRKALNLQGLVPYP